MDKEILLQSQKNNLEKELKIKIEEERPKMLEKLKYARSLGDLSENSEYHAARESQAILEGRILEIETILKHSKVVTSKKNSDTVDVGSVVTVKKNRKKIEYTVVGSIGADASKNHISSDSPMGNSLLGKKVGDKVSFETPGGITELEIKSIK